MKFPGTNNGLIFCAWLNSKCFCECVENKIGLGVKTRKIYFAIQHHVREISVQANILCSYLENRSFDTLTKII